MGGDKTACFGRRLAITQTELIGSVPGEACVGDEVHVIVGGQVLYVLRPPTCPTPETLEMDAYSLEDGEGGAFDNTLSPSKRSASAENSTLDARNDTHKHVRSLAVKSGSPRGDVYSFVGECLIHSLMDGEVTEYVKTQGVGFRTLYVR